MNEIIITRSQLSDWENEQRDNRHSFSKFYNKCVDNITKNITKHQAMLNNNKKNFHRSTEEITRIIRRNSDLLNSVTNAKDNSNIWCVAIWRGNDGIDLGRQAHSRMIYIKGTVDQIHTYIKNVLTNDEEITYITLMSAPPTVIVSK